MNQYQQQDGGIKMKILLAICSLLFVVSCNSEEKIKSKSLVVFSNEIQIKEILFKNDKPKGTIFGDVFFARIVSVDKDVLKDFVKIHIENDNLWKKGAIDSKGQEVFDFIIKWIEVEGLLPNIYKIADLNKIVKSQNIYYRIEDVKSRPDKVITNGTIYIIDTENNLLIILCQDT